jgi:glucoamylase
VAPDWQGKLHLYVLCAPHLQIGGLHNNGEVVEARGRRFLLAHRDDVYLAIAASLPFSRLSCGYVGVNDGWTDLAHNFRMDWTYDAALDGNIALTAEIDLSKSTEFTLGLGFGHTRHNAAAMVYQSLCTPFDITLQNFKGQ